MIKLFILALALLFITLKLTGTIAWSWWLVLLPLWFPVVAIGGVLSVVGIIVLSAAIAVSIMDN